MTWAVVTGAYPPQAGGVSDYTGIVARGLAASGDDVHVWTSACAEAAVDEAGVAVHRLPGQFGVRGLAQLNAGIESLPRPVRILVQYVPHAFGWKAMNLAIALWIYTRRRDDVTTMFHEVIFPFGRARPLRHNALAGVTHVMAALVARASRRMFVAIPSWVPMLRRLGARAEDIRWLPVPSNVPTRVAADAVAAVRRKLGLEASRAIVIGHFGTYSEKITPLLAPALVSLLEADPGRRVLLLGRGGTGFAEALVAREGGLRDRVIAPGGMPSDELAAHLAVCDLLVQPYPDGASSRRGSLMAGLALGKAIVTTEGELSEDLWRQSGAVRLAPTGASGDLVAVAEALLRDGTARHALGTRAASLYDERFAVEHTVRALREPSREIRD